MMNLTIILTHVRRTPPQQVGLICENFYFKLKLEWREFFDSGRPGLVP